MKPTITTLKMGQKVWATVDEVLDLETLIVSFNGDLLRVANRSDRIFRVGQRIQLNVASLKPLKFRLVETRRLQFGLDLEA